MGSKFCGCGNTLSFSVTTTFLFGPRNSIALRVVYWPVNLTGVAARRRRGCAFGRKAARSTGGAYASGDAAARPLAQDQNHLPLIEAQLDELICIPPRCGHGSERVGHHWVGAGEASAPAAELHEGATWSPVRSSNRGETHAFAPAPRPIRLP